MLEVFRKCLYPQGMTELDPAVVALIDALDAISDPVDRFQVTREIERRLNDELRGVRQRIALQLHEQGMSFREVGIVMGGVTASRAEQISRKAR